jgi:hypothetical protein
VAKDHVSGPAEAARDYFSGFINGPDRSRSAAAQKLVIEIESWIAGASSASSPASRPHQAPTVVVPEITLSRAVEKLKWTRTNPQSLWDYFDAFYGVHFHGMLGARERRIPDCPYTEGKIRDWSKGYPPKIPFVIPRALSHVESLQHVAKAFPAMLTNKDVDQVQRSENDDGIYGWMSIDAAIDAPYRVNSLANITGLSEGELAELFDRLGRLGQTVNVYALSGQALYGMWGWGRFPDTNGTDSRLLGTRFQGDAIGGHFDSKAGRLALDFRVPKDRHEAHLGARSVGDLTTNRPPASARH